MSESRPCIGPGRPTTVCLVARRLNPQHVPVPAARTGSARDRRGRGPRGPIVLAGPLSPHPPHGQARAQQFDDLVVSSVERSRPKVVGERARVTSSSGPRTSPSSPTAGWASPRHSAHSCARQVRAPARIVVFRRPVELRTRGRMERAALVHEVLVEHIAELLGREVEEIDPLTPRTSPSSPRKSSRARGAYSPSARLVPCVENLFTVAAAHAARGRVAALVHDRTPLSACSAALPCIHLKHGNQQRGLPTHGTARSRPASSLPRWLDG